MVWPKLLRRLPVWSETKKLKINFDVVFKVGKGDDIRSAIEDAKSKWVEALVSSIVEYAEAGKMNKAEKKVIDVILCKETQDMYQDKKICPCLPLIEEFM